MQPHHQPTSNNKRRLQPRTGSTAAGLAAVRPSARGPHTERAGLEGGDWVDLAESHAPPPIKLMRMRKKPGRRSTHSLAARKSYCVSHDTRKSRFPGDYDDLGLMTPQLQRSFGPNFQEKMDWSYLDIMFKYEYKIKLHPVRC